MNKRILIPIAVLILSLFSVNLFAKSKGFHVIGIVVNKDLYPLIKTSLQTYYEDMMNIDRHEVLWWDTTNFSDDLRNPNNTPSALKDSIKNHFDLDFIEGLILIGDLPIAYYKEGDDLAPCDLFYMDLDGTWEPAEATSTTPATSHTGGVEVEIWVTRLTMSVFEEKYSIKEDEAVKAYLEKVRNRMHGWDEQPRTCVIAGQKSTWPTLEAEGHVSLGYEADSIVKYEGNCGDQWKDALVAGKEYGFVYSQSTATSHEIGFTLDSVFTNDLDCRWYNVFGYSCADITTANLCGAYAYFNSGLISIGSAKNNGSMAPGTIMTFNQIIHEYDENSGFSFLYWNNMLDTTHTPDSIIGLNVDNKKWHAGICMQGVGNMYLSKYPTVAINYVGTQKYSSPLNLRLVNSRICYIVPKSNSNNNPNVRIDLYNMKGSLIRTLVNDHKSAGKYYVSLNNGTKKLAAGLYLCKMEVGDLKTTIRVVNK